MFPNSGPIGSEGRNRDTWKSTAGALDRPSDSAEPYFTPERIDALERLGVLCGGSAMWIGLSFAQPEASIYFGVKAAMNIAGCVALAPVVLGDLNNNDMKTAALVSSLVEPIGLLSGTTALVSGHPQDFKTAADIGSTVDDVLGLGKDILDLKSTLAGKTELPLSYLSGLTGFDTAAVGLDVRDLHSDFTTAGSTESNEPDIEGSDNSDGQSQIFEPSMTPGQGGAEPGYIEQPEYPPQYSGPPPAQPSPSQPPPPEEPSGP